MPSPWKGNIIRAIAASDTVCSVVVRHMGIQDQFFYDSGRQMRAASLIKLPVLWNLFEQAENHALSLSEEIALTKKYRTAGGLLHKFSENPVLRLEDYALLMCAVSDNSAANLLIDRLGMDSINATIKRLGMTQTHLQRKMCDAEARASGKENWTSAEDIALFYAHLIQHDGLSEQSCRRMLDMLSAQKSQNKLAAHIPCNDPDDLEHVLVHKTGELPGHEHDAGIFFPDSPDPIIAVVMTTLLSDRTKGIALSSRIGEVVWQSAQ